ncbi:hypothetical protein [Micromonospora avicenniae]|uniref:Cellulose binding domain-containing protein n=1 Tax=Micromonospora avicenniae TaxID=1198245 RepID=A0A1N6S3X7_9ACTN|nr:hypothetical protein [Micromonospora avicenniae]SIQ35779.1 hypothetical protein SAMN05444858_10288 [Micromonospora avicenniae]
MPVRPAGAPEPGTASKVVASAPWVVVLLGVLTLAILLLVASLSFRVREPEPAAAPGPPPVSPVSPAATNGSTAASPTPRTSPSRAAVSPSRAVRRSPTATSPRSPSAPQSNQPAPVDGGALTATYRVRETDRNDVVAELVLRNETGRPEEWTVDLIFTGRVRHLRVSGAPVSVVPGGDGRYVLRGHGSLPQGRSVELHLRFSRGDQLSGCAVNGNECVLA